MKEGLIILNEVRDLSFEPIELGTAIGLPLCALGQG
jgi:hypothetical protein